MIRAKKSKAKEPAPEPTLSGAVKGFCEVMRRANCGKAWQYVPELAWIFVLRFLDEREAIEEEAAAGEMSHPTLAAPYRWRDWAAPDAPMRQGRKGKVWKFVHQSLLPELKAMKERPGASPRQRGLSEMLAPTERTRIDTEQNFLEVLDMVHAISRVTADETELFSLSGAGITLTQVFDGLLLKLGAKTNDGGKFVIPPDVVRAMVRVVDPRQGETICDPQCGTGGFLVEAAGWMRARAGGSETAAEHGAAEKRAFHGWEADETTYTVALANLILHGIDTPCLGRQGGELSEGLMADAPPAYDCVFLNPSLSGSEGRGALVPDESRMNTAQTLQHMVQSLKPGGRGALVLDDGVLFETETLTDAKRRLVEECDVFCIVNVPDGILPTGRTGKSANLVFFEKGRPTERIWHYALPDTAPGKKAPLAPGHFDELFRLLSDRADSERSWTVDFAANRAAAFERARPYREAAAATAARAIELEEAWLASRDQDSGPTLETRALEEEWNREHRAAREAEVKALRLENAAYELKFANPYRMAAAGDRRLVELLATLDEQGRAVDGALSRLQSLLDTPEEPSRREWETPEHETDV